jgi:REP element-mobilizing transposase RayT
MAKTGVKHTIKKNSSYFLTLTVVGWVDVFTRPVYKDAIIESLKYCQQNKGLTVFAYVIMTNHLHLLVNTEPGFELSDTIRDFKRHTAKQITQLIASEPESRREWLLPIFHIAAIEHNKPQKIKLWQSGNHAIEVIYPKFTWTKINYIHNNPVKAKFVRKPEDWIYSSMSNYLGEESVLDEYTLTPLLTRLK